MVNPANVLLCGPPRSGTTLVCELLNAADNTIALDEPMDYWRTWKTRHPLMKRASVVAGRLRGRSASRTLHIEPAALVGHVERFLESSRRSLLAERSAYSKHVDGRVDAGKILDDRDGTGLRRLVEVRGVVHFDKPLTEDFVLAVKHTSGFTAAIEHLAANFPMFAIVRNPLSTLASWHSVNIPANRGRAPRAEQIDLDLHDRLEATPDVVDRQFILLAWFFDHYVRSLPDASVIPYEEVVATGGRNLAVVSPSAEALSGSLQSRNKASVYDQDLMRALGERLLGTDGPWWRYYSRDSVREVLGSG